MVAVLLPLQPSLTLAAAAAQRLAAAAVVLVAAHACVAGLNLRAPGEQWLMDNGMEDDGMWVSGCRRKEEAQKP